MSLRTNALAILAACMILQAAGQRACADSAPNAEYVVKTVFMYNFLIFVDWPEEKIDDSNEPLVIGVIGVDPFKDAFDAVRQKTVKDRTVIVRHFKGLEELEKAGEKKPSEPHPQLEQIQASHLLFVCRSEKPRVKEILQYVKGHHVLTVADTEGFVEAGGIINLLLEDEKVRFEINLTAAKQAGLQIRSRLLRLAKRTYKPPQE